MLRRMVAWKDKCREWFWANTLTRSLCISLIFHFTVFSGVEIGHRAGWWRASVITALSTSAMMEELKKALANRKLNSQEADKKQTTQNEPPLLFIEVDPEQATPEPPKQAKYYSSKNAIAANAESNPEKEKPKIDGKQTKIAKTETIPKPVPVQAPVPAPAPLQPNLTTQKDTPAKEKPDPVQTPVKPEKPFPGSETPGDLTLAKPQTRTGDGAQEAPAQRPKARTMAEMRQQKGIAGEKMKQEGGVKRRAIIASMDTKATPFGSYDAAIIAAIQKRWYDILDSGDHVRGRSGKVVIDFHLMPDGRVTAVRMSESDVGDLLALICERSIIDPSPFDPWPSDLRRLVQGDYREVRFTFYYE
jgi:hypothetical protein